LKDHADDHGRSSVTQSQREIYLLKTRLFKTRLFKTRLFKTWLLKTWPFDF
jgi:hypothetical protein